jgi:crotonobetainyl-CoA:carnitine CoA-transferase CaiB-like acyl-CoA transferase
VTDALSGIRVIDITRHMAGPYASALLSDFGADVIKVEPLPRGDTSRDIGVDFINGESAVFLMWNRGKRDIALDMRSDDGLRIFRRLVEDADVLMESFRPGVAERMGIGYDAMSAINPRLIYCSVSAFGSQGPWAARPGTDPAAQAMSGVMSVTGERDGAPILVGVPVGDFAGAMQCVQGILLALEARHRTGRGQRVEVSLLFALLSALTTRLASYWTTDRDPVRYGGAHSVVVPYQVFKTADGYAVAGVWAQEGWGRFCEAAGVPGLETDPRFATNPDRVEHRDALIEALEGIFVEHTTAHWDERFEAASALFAPVLSFSEILNHPQVQSAEVIQELPHPVAGLTRHLGPTIRLSDTPGRIHTSSPLLGQHTTEVLRQLGYSTEEIDDWAERGVVRAQDASAATEGHR